MTNSNGAILKIEDLHVEVEGKEIVKGLSLTIPAGEVHAVMGPNGSGKSTLANALMGHPAYDITGGHVYLKGEDITGLRPDERAQKGLFLAMQYPTSVPGVTMVNFLRAALKAVSGGDVPIREFRQRLMDALALLKMDESFARRYLNEGFSGGEKKRAEVLQMGILRPIMAVMDETDSGLDIDALRTVSEGINALREAPADSERGPMSILLITHYQRMLNYITPDQVHVLYRGRIVRSGGRELALELEAKGYDWITDPIDAEEGKNEAEAAGVTQGAATKGSN
jgi:Fe-S cluster assembly ATP-binding protein